VFHGGRDDVLADMAVLVQGKADGPVVALRPAGGEDELFTLAAERGGNRLARRGDSVARLLSNGASWGCPSQKPAYRKRRAPPLRERGWWPRDRDRSYRENPFFGLVRMLK